MGVRGLDEKDKYLMEIKLEDLETTRGPWGKSSLLAPGGSIGKKGAHTAPSTATSTYQSKLPRIEMGECFTLVHFMCILLACMQVYWMFNHQYIPVPGYNLKAVVGEQHSPVVQTATLFGSTLGV